MGNCLMINVNVPCEQLFLICRPQEGAPRRKKLIDLQNDWERLKAAKVDTLRKIDESPQMRPLEQVYQWLLRVTTLEDEVERFQIDYAQESANKCLCSYCPRNCKKSYDLWGKIEPMDQEVRDLLSQKPDVIVEMPLVASAQRVPTESTTGMQSMLDEVWSHVQDEQDVGLIGLYGMGGVGKTTLLKAVNNKLCRSSRSFDLQLWVVVSKSPNLEDIQNYIGKSIGLSGNNWERKSPEAKATDIYNILDEKKYILLLDDIWERFDLIKIGIPLPNLTNKSKVIFTTRSKQVCGEMKARKIQVQCLKEEEAWNLFKENVGEEALNVHHAIPGLAKEIMRECSGLPLALIVIGRAMTCKTTTHEWEHAIAVLKRGNVVQSSTVMGEVFTPLKYSFDNLPNDTIKSCLLYCSLYPEDHVISKSELIDKWICEDFMGEFNDQRKDRINEGYDYIGTLVNASLLEEYTTDEVKMHDVIRDMMIHISGNKFCVKARAGLTQIPNNFNQEHVQRMSLMENPIGELDERPTECPNLKTMFLMRASLCSIKIDLSKFVPNLQVLDLSANPDLTSLPDEICELVHLQYLNLWQTNIQEIPVELKKLVKLKYLNLELTKISKIPEGILSNLKELSVFKWISIGVPTRNTNFLSEKLVKELEGLANLQDLTMSTDSKVDIARLTSSAKLLSCITGLTLTHFSDSDSLNILFLRGMKHLRHLLIGYLEKVETIVAGEEGLETSAMNNQNAFNTSLQYLTVIDCGQLKNLSWLVFFPYIEKINVVRCPEMQTLVGEDEYNLDNELEPFAKLEELYLINLPKLETICVTPSPFPCLSRLGVIYGCNRLKKLPFDSSSCGGGGEIKIFGEKLWWDELQWEDEATLTTFSPSFQSMSQFEVLMHYRTIQIISKHER